MPKVYTKPITERCLGCGKLYTHAPGVSFCPTCDDLLWISHYGKTRQQLDNDAMCALEQIPLVATGTR